MQIPDALSPTKRATTYVTQQKSLTGTISAKISLSLRILATDVRKLVRITKRNGKIKNQRQTHESFSNEQKNFHGIVFVSANITLFFPSPAH
ncbi:hypothetical protein CDAR_389421 [Caerostris darwini]|uniref:Uncharacterized protein n=1 Tax=Caerostris darwini TaxID=1538125 RepID=A0AAV4UXL2_9ARAC|nr:hypothetical protein CDAR_389421 [Caerostris darwini]